MDKYYRNLFASLKQVEPPHGLCGTVLSRIKSEERRLFVFGLLRAVPAMLCSVAFLFSINFAVKEIADSSFYQYLSVLFSDGSVIASVWKDFTLLLVESFPLLGLTLVGITGFAFLGSLTFTVPNAPPSTLAVV